MVKHWLAVVAILGTLGGCLSLGPLQKEAKAPDWVLNPPPDTGAEWFGVGEGPDRDAARRAALKDVATKLRVSISGRLESQITETNGKVDRQARNRVSEEVQKTEFRNFSVEQTAQSGKSFYSLVKVDRGTFVSDVKAKLDPLDADIEQSMAGLEKASPIERFVGYRRLLPIVDRATGQAQLLVGAQNGGPAIDRLKRYQSIQQKAAEAPGALVFLVQSAPQDADVAGAVGTFVNENGMRADTAANSAGNVLAVKAVHREDVLYGSKVVKLNVNLNVRDDKGQSLASRDYEVSGTSRYDHKAARQNAVQALLEAMRAEGAVAGLGFGQK